MAVHERHWGREHVSYNPVHYLALLERKPGALDVARPLSDWVLPECFGVLRRRLEADLGHRGTREFIKVLRLMERCSLNQLAGAVIAALEMGATSADADRSRARAPHGSTRVVVQPRWPAAPEALVDRSTGPRRLPRPDRDRSMR